MDIFEYNEVRWPTRALQQEEEEQAAADAEQALTPPKIEWQQGQARDGNPYLLVLALTPATTALLTAAMGPEAQVAGHVVAAQPLPSHAGQSAHTADQPAAVYAPQPGVLVCCCSTALAPEQAGAWARAVLQELNPQRLLLLGSMQAEQYRGEADASQELLAFVLRSTQLRQQQHQQEQQQQQQQQPVPCLPSGSIVSGLPAAVLTQAELLGLPAELLVVVEQVPSLVPETLLHLSTLVAAALREALPGAGGGGGGAKPQQWAQTLTQKSVVDAARLKLQRSAYRPSSVYS